MKKSRAEKLIDWLKNHPVFSWVVVTLTLVSIILAFTSNLGSSWDFFNKVICWYEGPPIEGSSINLYFGLTGTTTISFLLQPDPLRSCEIGPFPITLDINNTGDQILHNCILQIEHTDKIRFASNELSLKSQDNGLIEGDPATKTSLVVGDIFPGSSRKINLLIFCWTVVSSPKVEIGNFKEVDANSSVNSSEKTDRNLWENVYKDPFGPRIAGLIFLDSNGCPITSCPTQITIEGGEKGSFSVLVAYTPGPFRHNMWATLSGRGFSGKTTKLQMIFGPLIRLQEFGYPIFTVEDGQVFRYKGSSK